MLCRRFTGDLAKTAVAAVRYKEKTASEWKIGHPLHRIRADLSERWPGGQILNAFAWPIIDLTPGTSYEVEVTVTDGSSSDIKTANFGVAGDTTQGVLWGLKNGEGQGFQPKAVMLMIGTNNTGTFTAPEIAEGVGAIVGEMRRDFPSAKILLLAIFPRSVPGDPVRDKIAEVNRIISRLDDKKNVFYMDIGAQFLDEKGVFLADAFRPDNLHPAAKGYDIWGQAVSAKLAELMK